MPTPPPFCVADTRVPVVDVLVASFPAVRVPLDGVANVGCPGAVPDAGVLSVDEPAA